VSTAGWELLAEPRRRAVFALLRRRSSPATRDEVAAELGLDRKLAAHHLDRLAGAGLLLVTYQRPPGRSGPGAGRPAKHYALAEPEVSMSVPARRYDLAARIFAAALTSEEPRTALAEVAVAEGRQIADALTLPEESRPVRRAAIALDALGYAPQETAEGITLQNCPFHALLDVSTDLVCGTNIDFCRGLLDGLGVGDAVTPVLDPAPDERCCVLLTAAP
jgi:predicted ArsR family transcriptional regulator